MLIINYFIFEESKVKVLSIVCIFIMGVSGCAHKNNEQSNNINNQVSITTPNIKFGSGSFSVKGGKNREQHTVNVFYHKPKGFTEHSPILIVIPGAGRNADDYRDSWIASSEKYNTLILSPSYKEKEYDFAAYHLGGVIENIKFLKAPKQEKYNNRMVFKIDDDRDLSFNPNYDSESFIFEDFDRIFDDTVKALNSKQTQYDIFGHSAGGQIAHRLAVFKPNTKANRILASNSGSYTVPSLQEKLPFGTLDALLSKSHLQQAFSEELILFIGEKDNENETGGMILHSPAVNKQGLHRLSRARYFYNKSKKMAAELGLEFNWQLIIVPDVGHKYRLMGQAAASYLYQETNNKQS